MKALNQIVKFFRSSLFAEYLPMLFIVVAIVALALVMIDKKDDQEKTTNIFSCANSSISSIGTTREYENYRNSFETYTDESVGFSFQYPPNMEIFATRAMGNH